MRSRRLTKRRGAATVEAAAMFGVLFLLLLGLIIGGLGVFRYFEVDCLARESARWLSVRGKTWASDTGNPSPTQQQLLNQVVLPMAAGMDKSCVSVQAEWVNRITGVATNWDDAPKSRTSYTSNDDPVTNHVRVTVTYRWMPEASFLGGPYYLKSVTEVPMSY
jgi:hypothetical protein